VRASDDPAGLAISDQLNAEIRSLAAAGRNAQDGISLIQIYEGGTNEINNMLLRIRELAMQASSDTVGGVERSMLNTEVSQLKEEITRVANTTEYAGTALLSGAGGTTLEFQVGPNNRSEIDRISFNPGDSNLTGEALGVDSIDLSEKENAQQSLEVLDAAISRVNEVRMRVGSAQSRLETTITAQAIFRENLTAARSRIIDADLAIESTNMARESILRQSGTAVLAQANQTPALALQLLKT
jgi:flagellin